MALLAQSPTLGGTVTSTTLLHGLGDPADQAAWQAYVDRYRPLILQYARRVGFRAEEAEDLAQAALCDFAADFGAGKYDRSRGRLRSWLFGIVLNQVRAWRRRAVRRKEVLVAGHSSECVFEDLESPSSLECIWEDEWQQAVVQRALAQVRSEVDPRTLSAFEMFALHDVAAEEVASELGMSANAVYGAKRRILNRLRELMPFMEETW